MNSKGGRPYCPVEKEPFYIRQPIGLIKVIKDLAHTNRVSISVQAQVMLEDYFERHGIPDDLVAPEPVVPKANFPWNKPTISAKTGKALDDSGPKPWDNVELAK